MLVQISNLAVGLQFVYLDLDYNVSLQLLYVTINDNKQRKLGNIKLIKLKTFCCNLKHSTSVLLIKKNSNFVIIIRFYIVLSI